MAPSAVGEAYCFNQVSRGQRAMIDLTGSDTKAITLEPIAKGAFEGWLAEQSDSEKTWLAASQFKGKEGEVCALPAAQGGIDRVVFGVEDPNSLWGYAALPGKLPPGVYVLPATPNADAAALGWMLGAYSYDRYKTKKNGDGDACKAQLEWPVGCNREHVVAVAEGIFLARDMITTPAEDMGRCLE
jgi:leucyl aminopeptidase